VAAVQYTFTHRQYTERHKQYVEQASSLNGNCVGRAQSLRVIPWHFTLQLRKKHGKHSVRVVGSVVAVATHDAHHSQTHSQQRTLTQHDMLPQHPVNIRELFCECF